MNLLVFVVMLSSVPVAAIWAASLVNNFTFGGNSAHRLRPSSLALIAAVFGFMIVFNDPLLLIEKWEGASRITNGYGSGSDSNDGLAKYSLSLMQEVLKTSLVAIRAGSMIFLILAAVALVAELPVRMLASLFRVRSIFIPVEAIRILLISSSASFGLNLITEFLLRL